MILPFSVAPGEGINLDSKAGFSPDESANTAHENLSWPSRGRQRPCLHPAQSYLDSGQSQTPGKEGQCQRGQREHRGFHRVLTQDFPTCKVTFFISPTLETGKARAESLLRCGPDGPVSITNPSSPCFPDSRSAGGLTHETSSPLLCSVGQLSEFNVQGFPLQQED